MDVEKKVLIVEKDTGIANMIRAILGIVNVGAVHVTNGGRALEAIANQPLGLIIAEWEMHDMRPQEFIAALRDNPVTAQTPLIMLVPEDNKDYQKAVPSTGADRYITKPFTARKVLDVVKEFVVFKEM